MSFGNMHILETLHHYFEVTHQGRKIHQFNEIIDTFEKNNFSQENQFIVYEFPRIQI